MSFFAGSFALAGLALAAAPLLIHLLHRRRFRVVAWAAMDFLRDAMRRERRLLRLRDLVLLVIRTLCVLCFGLAMARPFFSRSGGDVALDQPVHAVVIIDNSASSSWRELRGSVLEQAQETARAFVEELPEGSRVTVLPTCGAADVLRFDALRSNADAIDAIDALRPVDAVAPMSRGLDLAFDACRRVRDLPAQRVVVIGDQQRVNFSVGSLAAQIERLPEVQLVEVGPRERDNAWVADFRVQDEIADAETPAVLIATIRYEGAARRVGVPVRLIVDGVTVATRAVDLEPGQSREEVFRHTFGRQPALAETVESLMRPRYARALVSIGADDLAIDDQRALVVPVVASLPVVFIDEVGSAESPEENRFGETVRLRRLLAPSVRHEERARQLVRVRHAAVAEVDEALLCDARLVVIAGVEDPAPIVELLRGYVEQGGQLVIAAGGDFDPAAWNAAAWLDGAGILPAPLAPSAVGALPDLQAGELAPFFLDPESLVGEYFRLESESDEVLRDIFQDPLFFRAVVADVSDERVALLVAKEAERRAATSTEASSRTAARPRWLAWRRPDDPARRGVDPRDLAAFSRPRVLARYSNGLPFLVERSIGEGAVVLVTSGVYSAWNTLTTTHAVFVFDRIFRTLLRRTMRTVDWLAGEPVEIPIEAADRRASFRLERPDGESEALAVESRGAGSWALAIRDPDQRGHYVVRAHRDAGGAVDASRGVLWELAFAVNGPSLESELAPIDRATLETRFGDARCALVARDEPVRVEGALAAGLGTWKLLMAAVLALLVGEMLVLAVSSRRRSAPVLPSVGRRAPGGARGA